jgi:plastocyanin
VKVLLGILAVLLVTAAPAQAQEKLLTLYSPPFDSEPYVHRSTTVTLKPDGRQAPAEPGYILGFKEQVLVDSKDPNAKPLPVTKMMVHHLLYYAGQRVDQDAGGCLGGAFIGGRGEEHPDGQFGKLTPPAARARYGIHNVTAAGRAPEWSLTAMVMNHYQRVKRFYVRTRIWYTTAPRTPIFPTTVGECSHIGNGMAYDVPGGGKPGSTFVDHSTWTVPFSARILAAGSHNHGGAIHQTLTSRTCNRPLLDAKAYYGAADHPYNTIRPILHEPGPIANGTFTSLQGIPLKAGEVLERTAVHDDSTLHVAAMGFWILALVKDDSVSACAPLPTDVREVTRPVRYDHAAPYVYDRVVPQLARPSGPWSAFTGAALSVGDRWFRHERLTARVGEKLTWRFTGVEPHSVTVANGPRGFSSNYLGNERGTYSFTPTVPGTYRLTCLIHPTTMSQTLQVTGS